MKKFLILLLLIFGVVISVSAVETQKLLINVHIPPTEPIFLLKASLSQDSGYVTTSLDCDTDVSVDDVVVYIKIYQTNRARIKKSYQLTVTADPLKMDDDNITDSPTLEQIVKFTSVTDMTVTGDEAELTLVYPTGKPVQPYYKQTNAGDLLTLKSTWAAKDYLAVGDYSGYITFTYTVL